MKNRCIWGPGRCTRGLGGSVSRIRRARCSPSGWIVLGVIRPKRRVRRPYIRQNIRKRHWRNPVWGVMGRAMTICSSIGRNSWSRPKMRLTAEYLPFKGSCTKPVRRDWKIIASRKPKTLSTGPGTTTPSRSWARGSTTSNTH